MSVERCRIRTTGWAGTPEEYSALLTLGAEPQVRPEPFDPVRFYNDMAIDWLYYADVCFSRAALYRVTL